MGVWRDFKITSPEDQTKFILPLNRLSEQIVRDQRMIVDTNVDYPNVYPATWEVTKVHRLAPNGVTRITLAEDRFDQFKDYPDYDENGNIVGFYADYYSSTIPPMPEPKPQIIKPQIHGEITWSGLKPEIKLGGSYKTFTVNFYNTKNELVDLPDGIWKLEIDDFEVPEDDYTVLNSIESTSLSSNQIKIKFANNRDYLGKIMKLSYVSSCSCELLVELKAL